MTKKIPSLLREAKLETVQLTKDAAVAGRLIAELKLRTLTGASIVGIARAGVSLINPGPEEELLPGDEILLLIGSTSISNQHGVLNLSDILTPLFRIFVSIVRTNPFPLSTPRAALTKKIPSLLREAKLETVQLAKDAAVADRLITELKLRTLTGVSIVGITRAGVSLINPLMVAAAAMIAATSSSVNDAEMFGFAIRIKSVGSRGGQLPASGVLTCRAGPPNSS